jgi:hypothetical protein
MGYIDVQIELRGDQLLQHKYNGEQPSIEKPPRGNKTQAHIDAMHRKDWFESVYFAKNTIHMPPEVIEAAIRDGAKRTRKGKNFERGSLVVEDFIPLLVFKSAEDRKGSELRGSLEEFYRPEYIDIRGVNMPRGGKVDRCRPIFRNWGLRFTLRYDDEQVSVEHIESALKNMCIGDFRPRFGKVKYFHISEGKSVVV